jgi:thiol-disulfide isomerase/thioredoxin
VKRRHHVQALLALGLPVTASAGVVDWWNGVKLGSVLPEYDTEYLGSAPPSEFKLQLIDFWATWCAPCREEFPHLNALHARFASEGLSVVGLTRESRAVAEAFLPKVGINYPIGAAGNRPLQQVLGIKALPYALLTDRKRVIVWRGQASSLKEEEVSRRLRSAA